MTNPVMVWQTNTPPIVPIFIKVMPRPTDGFVHAQASASRARPVSEPSAGSRRRRSMMPPIGAIGVIGSPSSQCACSGHARMTAFHTGSCRICFSGGSAAAP